jgi:UDP-3-O-[3-hydroxymyristoyl] glucosamine N-acyltransferase
MQFRELVQQLGHGPNSLSSAADPEITGVAAITDAVAGQLSYVEGGRFAQHVATTQATALILPKSPELQALATDRQIAWLEVANPRYAFAQAIALFYQPFRPAAVIHPTAVIDPSAQVGEGVAIGAHVVIQAGVKIADRACIHPNVVIYPAAEIGENAVLHANCVIHERSQIGPDCVIHSGVVIGAEGFGFVPTREGWLKMEQSGRVVLESGVEVGCNSCIDRPAVGETRIGRNTKIDNHVQIGHGVQVGEACAFAAQVGLAGGSEVGNRVILAGQVGVANLAKVGDGVTASAKAGIHKDVPAGMTVSGYPAIEHKQYLRSAAAFTHLAEMYKFIQRLKRQSGAD